MPNERHITHLALIRHLEMRLFAADVIDPLAAIDVPTLEDAPKHASEGGVSLIAILAHRSQSHRWEHTLASALNSRLSPAQAQSHNTNIIEDEGLPGRITSEMRHPRN